MPSEPPRLTVLVLDSIEPERLAPLIEAERVPAIAGALRRGLCAELSSDAPIFPAAVWPTAFSGVGAGAHGAYGFHGWDAARLAFVPWRIGREYPRLWDMAARCGFRSLVLDPANESPRRAPPPLARGLPPPTLVHWGPHPMLGPPASDPPSLIRDILHRHGRHPCVDDDPYVTGARALASIRDRLVRGTGLRGEVMLDLLGRGRVDLAVLAFTEAHTAGHQFANLEEPRHPGHDPATLAALGGRPWEEVIEATDRAVGRVLDRLGPEAEVLLLFVPGIAPYFGGEDLLEPVLERMGLLVRPDDPAGPPEPASPTPRPSVPRQGPARRALRAALALYHRLVPEPARAAFGRALPRDILARFSSERFRASIDWERTRAFTLPHQFASCLRVNRAGRERFGIVAPGTEEAALLDRIEEELRALRVVGKGDPAVREVIRADLRWPGPAREDLPDLVVTWRSERPIAAVASERLGRIESLDPGRRASHSGEGVLVALGPRFAPGRVPGRARLEDLAPTILALLGAEAPAGLDGRPMKAIARARTDPAVSV